MGVAVVGLLVPAGSAVAVDSIDSGEVLAEHKRAQKHSVTLRGPAKSVVSGTRFKVTGTVVGAKPKKATVKLQRKKKKNAKKTWVTVAKTKTKTTKKQSRYSKKLMFAKASRVTLRAVVAKSSRYCSSPRQRQCGPKRIASAPVRVTFAAPATPSQSDAPSVLAPATPPAEVSTPPVSAPRYPGTVVDCDNGASVGDAVAAAAGGDTLNISGTCEESDIVIDRNLTLTGNGRIDAQQKGRVLFIDGVNVSITGDLTLTGGKVSGSYPNGDGGGIYNDEGTLNLSGNARVIGNTADSGGGIGVQGYLTGFVNISDNASISGNTADRTGGGVLNSCATVNLNGGSISNNTAGSYGGIFNAGSCSDLNINNGTIAKNKATTGAGGGIGSFQGQVTLNGGSITQNTAATDGGGIYKYELSIVNISGGSITGNSAGRNGGGIHNGDLYVEISGGSITGNSAGNNGGGIYNENSMLYVVAEVRGVFNGAEAPDSTNQGSWNRSTGQSNSPDDIYSDVP